MPVSIVHVQHRDGSPARQVRVVLGFEGFFGGMTRETYTDRDGVAVVEHPSAGRAKVYVSGKAYHSFHAPGRTAVTV